MGEIWGRYGGDIVEPPLVDYGALHPAISPHISPCISRTSPHISPISLFISLCLPCVSPMPGALQKAIEAELGAAGLQVLAGDLGRSRRDIGEISRPSWAPRACRS